MRNFFGLLLLLSVLVPSRLEAKGKRWVIERTGKNEWVVEESPVFIEDPDRFAFPSSGEVGKNLKLYGTDAERVCGPLPDRPKDGKARCMEIARSTVANRYSSNVDCGQLAEHFRVLQILESQTGRRDYRRETLEQVAAKLENCRARAHAEVQEWLRKDAERCEREDAERREEYSRAVAANDKCRDGVEQRVLERRSTADTRPVEEILAIPGRYRLSEEVDRLEAEDAKMAKKKAVQGKRAKAARPNR